MDKSFGLFDKIWYNGNIEKHKALVWTVTDINEPLDQYRVENDLLGRVELMSSRVMDFMRQGSPIYGLDQVVHFILDEAYIAARISDCVISLNAGPNVYTVVGEAIELGGAFEKQFPETELFLLNRGFMEDSTITTTKHINRVRDLLQGAAFDLLERGRIHDASKLFEPEKSPLDMMEYVNKYEGNAPYGSEAYITRARLLKPMLKHHYSVSPHHPEHYENGVYGMNLGDLFEMAMDFIAASERNNDPVVGLTKACERFNIDTLTKRIMSNTYDKMGVKWE